MSLRGDDNENDREAGKTTKKGKKRHVYWIKFVLVSLVILLLHVAPVTCVADNNTSAEGIAEVNSAGASKNLTVAQIRCTPGEGKVNSLPYEYPRVRHSIPYKYYLDAR